MRKRKGRSDKSLVVGRGGRAGAYDQYGVAWRKPGIMDRLSALPEKKP